MRPMLVRLLALVPLAAVAACVSPFGADANDTPLAVTVSVGTATAPLISWDQTGATSVWVTDPDGRTVWGIEAGNRSLPDNRSERVLIASPVPYAAHADRTGATEETPRTTTEARQLEPGVTYTAQVSFIGGGSGGFTGRRPVVRRGSATFMVPARVDPE